MGRRSWVRRGGAFAAAVAVYAGYVVLVRPALPANTPEWLSITVLAVALVATGYGAQAVDRWLWNRTAAQLGLDPVGTTTVERFASRAHRGTRRGREVVFDFRDVPRSLVGDRTVVRTPHEGDAPVLVVQQVGGPGTGSSDLPPRIELGATDFEAGFRAYGPDSELGRAVLDATVREALVAADELVELRVEDGQVVAETPGAVTDAAVVDRHFTAVCLVAERLERALDA